MEILRLAGYTEEEKVRIAERWLLPKERAAHGLREDELRIESDALRRIVRDYTREAGVRELDRQIAAVARKVALRIAEGRGAPVSVRAPTYPNGSAARASTTRSPSAPTGRESQRGSRGRPSAETSSSSRRR